jgi:hypothetical protein
VSEREGGKGEGETDRKTESAHRHTHFRLIRATANTCQRGRLRPAWRVGRTGVKNHLRSLRYLLKCESGRSRYRGSCSLRLERGGHLCAAELWL